MPAPREMKVQLRGQGDSLRAIADKTGATVAVVRNIVGKTDGGKAKRERQETTAKRIDAEGGTCTVNVKKWKKATGQSEATFWRVLKELKNSSTSREERVNFLHDSTATEHRVGNLLRPAVSDARTGQDTTGEGGGVPRETRPVYVRHQLPTGHSRQKHDHRYGEQCGRTVGTRSQRLDARQKRRGNGSGRSGSHPHAPNVVKG